MASYSNKFPDDPQKDDVISFSGATEKSYQLKKDTVFYVSLTGGGGGNGGWVYSGTSGNLLATGGDGGGGGNVSFTIAMAAGTYRVAVGAGGSSPGSQSIYSSPATPANGGAGGATTLKNSSSQVIAQATGGGGGTGGYASHGNGSGAKNGTAGTNGSATAYATRGCTGISYGGPSYYSGSIRMTVIIPNELPTAPGSISYGKPSAGKPLALTVTPATDPEGTAITYTFERQVDSGAWTQVGATQNLTHTDTVPDSGELIRYRAKATDAQGGESAYITGEARAIDYNKLPEISGLDGVLDACSDEAPSWPYAVDDADEGDAVEVVEALDGAELRRFIAEKGELYQLTIPRETWLSVPNGEHVLTIAATDGKDVEVRTLTFTRRSTRLAAATGQATTTCPKACTLTFVPHPATWPADAEVSVRVCNDAYAAQPHWESFDNTMINGNWYTFDNQATGEGECGIGVAVTAEEGDSGRAVEIEAIIIGVS